MAKATIKIGLCGTPARMISHEVVLAKKILLTYGGGMGGASEKIYCTKKELKAGIVDMYALTLLSGEVIEVNPAFIVKVEDRRLVKVVCDVTSHSYFNAKNFKSMIITEYIGLKFEEDYVIVNDYVSREDGRLIQKDEDVIE